MKQLSLDWSDDYAVLSCGRYTYYYGYEYIENDEYNFVVLENKSIIFSMSETEINKVFKNYNANTMNDYLLFCIGYYMYIS